MPLISPSTYRTPAWLRGGHLQTIYPVLFRPMPELNSRHERLELADGDFLDLEWSGNAGKKLAIICHGLEGSARAAYVRGMAARLLNHGWDILAWSYRGCSDEPNRLISSYHTGKTDDLDLVIRHGISQHPAERIVLIGFSLGGNLILKYIGERGTAIDRRITRGVAFSAPCDLACCSAKLSQWQNKIYLERFLKTLRSKVQEKHQRFPAELDLRGLGAIHSFAGFDGQFTAPLHGFSSAEDYWERSSSRQFLGKISIPTLLVSALNDPILGPKCYPFDEARLNKSFFLETPPQGGHLGFYTASGYWSETRAIEFLSAS